MRAGDLDLHGLAEHRRGRFSHAFKSVFNEDVQNPLHRDTLVFVSGSLLFSALIVAKESRRADAVTRLIPANKRWTICGTRMRR